jgi:excisionase family DNA binding protein
MPSLQPGIGRLLMAIANHPGNNLGRPLPRLLSIKQATYELGISRTSMYELITDRKLRTVKIGRRRFVPREAIEEFIVGLSA